MKKPKKFISITVEIVLAIAVIAFLGFHTISFFQFIFPQDKYYLSILGFALTSGAVVSYFIIFKMGAQTSTQKTIAAGMMIISFIGEIVAAGMGMQVEAWSKIGIALTESEIDMMILLVQGLALVHGVAIMLYYALDDILELLADEDGDGVANFADKDYKKKPRQQSVAVAADTRQEKPKKVKSQ